jgi:hypothetical protein
MSINGYSDIFKSKFQAQIYVITHLKQLSNITLFVYLKKTFLQVYVYKHGRHTNLFMWNISLSNTKNFI